MIEAESADEVFDPVRAAHTAVESERIITSLEVDDAHDREQEAADRVESVASVLGREPTRGM